MEILIIFILIVLNGLFAMAEIAIVSSRKVRLIQKAEAGNERARVALKLAHEPGPFLSAIQIGITSIGVLNGAFGETAIASGLSETFSNLPVLAPYSKTISMVIMVTAITYFTVVIGELVPKRIALHNPESIAILVARPMRWLSRIAYPVVRLLSISSDILLTLIGSKRSNEPTISEEEIRTLMKQGTEEGIFEKTEHDFVSNIFRMDDARILTIMTPRKDIIYWDVHDSLEENMKKVIDGPHNFLPVCEGGLDHTRGLLQAKDLLTEKRLKTLDDIRSILKPVSYVPESISAIRLLENFRTAKKSLALVVDEYGSVEGLVTLYDVLEAVVGEIPWVQSDAEATLREDGSWLIDGGYTIEKFKALFGLPHFPGEENDDFHTLGGLFMARVGKVPSVSDFFECNGFRFEVIDMDVNRIDKVLVSRIAD
jgi:putative hemolysin